MKDLFEYLKKSNVIVTVLILLFCSVTYALRENVEFQEQTIEYINLAAIGILMVMVYTAVRKRFIRWSYIVCVLLMIFVFNRFYDKTSFEKIFPFNRQFFFVAVGIVSIIAIFYPFIKDFLQKIKSPLERWVEHREGVEKQGQHSRRRKRAFGKYKNSTEMADEASGDGGVHGSDEAESKRHEKNSIVNIALFFLVLMTLIIVSGFLLFVVSSTQVSSVIEKMTSENMLTVILSFIVSFLLIVFFVGIIVSLLIKWVRIIIDIIKERRKGETYFILAICLFIISQYIFSVYPHSTDDVADILINGELFTFPLILCILIPVFLIFAENIASYSQSNDRIKKEWKICKDKAIDIASGIILSLLNFIQFVTSDYLRDIIELTEEGDFKEKNDSETKSTKSENVS